MNLSTHTFHIPVMGLAYTIDSPVKVARFGISSVISIIEDTLVEKMRQVYCALENEDYIPITEKDEDYRARRITEYLNLINRIVQKQIEKLKNSAFEPGSDIVQYFEMLPDNHSLKNIYRQMCDTSDEQIKTQLQNQLRSKIQPGAIDVNIMTKLDGNSYDKEGNPIENGSDAVSALRGYANSNLTSSSIIFSAGMNPRLYTYLEGFDEFTKIKDGTFEKKIVIKVSDYRSALIQGKFLAKKGLWVSEYRIESGLNCGGHAFATDGYLLGPILEEFKNNREKLTAELFQIYRQAAEAKNLEVPSESPEMRITVQGGIGTHEEDKFLLEYYNVDGTGWGTPFLLVPEATTVDPETLEKLSLATEKDIVLSKNSPLGVRFHYLKGLSGEKEKNLRIANGKPGSPCTEHKLAFNTDFTKLPICTASRSFLKNKLKQIFTQNLSKEESEKLAAEATTKECLCVGLSNSAFIKYEAGPIAGNTLAVTICPGPNLAYFSKISSLREMVDHIYGRINLLSNPENRPHMFVKELKLYVDYLKEQINESINQYDEKLEKYHQTFCKNLIEGINYYKEISSKLIEGSMAARERLNSELQNAERQIQTILESFALKTIKI